MDKSFLDCRLLHIDYDKHLCGSEKRSKQTESKNKLLFEFINSFGLTNAIIKDNKIISESEIWYFTVTHAKGTTMVYFSKWPAGIDCLALLDVSDNYLTLVTKHFTSQECEWLKDNSSKANFARLWCAKEALFKCYYNEKHKIIDFSEWKFKISFPEIVYSKLDEKYICHQGISDSDYIFYVCEKK